ncbi:MAG: tRNA (cytidine(56)-2'-O)-methyltransferase [Candidatus Aenigmarchaeota archaeon]|nr:tRNA (cytidine(56)-2'-O)-methyltransferase [Candidatus Aenigmarchaeota archaeon]
MICVLRLGHRIERDKRLSTHCGLVARAFGAQKLVYTGQKDSGLEESINSVTNGWGGPFQIEHSESARKLIKDWKGKSIHLTVYGIPVQEKIRTLRKVRNLLIVIGGEKVPPEVYQDCDWNISISQQPHSEVGALAVFLHEYFRGRELEKKFRKAQKRVVPQERGKKVVGQTP